jgi:hypothetical protein
MTGARKSRHGPPWRLVGIRFPYGNCLNAPVGERISREWDSLGLKNFFKSNRSSSPEIRSRASAHTAASRKRLSLSSFGTAERCNLGWTTRQLRVENKAWSRVRRSAPRTANFGRIITAAYSATVAGDTTKRCRRRTASRTCPGGPEGLTNAETSTLESSTTLTCQRVPR